MFQPLAGSDLVRSNRRRFVRAVHLPYRGGSLAMVLVRPRRDLRDLEGRLDGVRLDRLFEGRTEANVVLEMPRFRIEGRTTSLATHLAGMGMPSAFRRDADFSGISRHDGDPLFIGEVIHKAFLEADEVGTEAAAATAVVGIAGPPPGLTQPLVKLTLDRPFLFAVVNTHLGALLFMGRVTQP